jgi:hypothetical protein
MIARVVLPLVLSLLLPPIATAKDRTREEVADDYLRRGLLTKDQHTLLRSNQFLDSKCASDKLSSCVPQINFGAQCGITRQLKT